MHWDGRSGWTLRHERLKGSGRRDSYFLASLINIFTAMGQGALLHSKLQNMGAFTDRMHRTLKSLAVERTVHEPLLEAFQQEGVSANYFRASGWTMLPDVSSIRNQDVDTNALLHAHMRTHADALGATISKCCKPRDSTETCPTCNMAASETFAHTAFACTNHQASDLARRHSAELTRYMRSASPTWVRLYEEPSATDSRKACLVLHAANFLENDRIDSTHDFRVRKAVAIVGMWLEELRLKHRLYRRLARNVSVHALNYYATDSSPSATSDTSEGADGDL